MKKKVYPFLLLALCISSCEKENFNYSIIERDFSIKKIANTPHPNAQFTQFFDWENTTNILLPGYSSTRTLPWFSSATTAIPHHILVDYKKEDGWELLYNLCATPGEIHQNYFILYNKFTGILRSFYFLNESVTTGSNGLWGITINGNNSLLNNTGYFATPSSDKTNNPVYVTSNITNESIAKTINRGWNAFDAEFTYDRDVSQPLVFSISTYNKNIQDITLSGDLDLQSNGTIVSTSSKNPVQDALKSGAKTLGSAAKDEIKLKADSGFFKIPSSLIPGIISGGVTNIINAGINLIFGSFIGKMASTTQTTEKIEFKTHGKITLNGSITGTEATNVAPVASLLVPGTDKTLLNNAVYPYYNKNLGVWNLSAAPEVKVQNKAVYLSENSNGAHLYMRSISLDPASINVVVNPDLLSEISNYTVSTNLVYYKKFDNNINWDSNPSSGGTVDLSNSDLIFDDGKNQLYKKSNYSEIFYGDAPPYQDPNMDHDIPSMTINSFTSKFVVKVTITLYPKVGYNTDPIVITRSYIPKYKFVN